MKGTNTSDSAHREPINRDEVSRLYKELNRQAIALGYGKYLSQKYYYDKISNRLNCSSETIRKIFNKRETFKNKQNLWKS